MADWGGMRVWACPSGGWEIARGRPHERLRPGVRGYRGYRIDLGRTHRRLELPGGLVTLLVGLGPPVRVSDPAGADGRAPRSLTSLFAGPHTRAVLGEHDGRAYGVQVLLTPWAAHRLLAVDMGDFTDSVADLDAVLGGRRARNLADALATAPGWAERFALLDRLLTSLLVGPSRLIGGRVTGPELNPQVLRAWELLAAGPRTVPLPVARVAAEVGWSERQLRRRFQEQIGLSPKAVARVARLRRGLALLTRGHPASATALACGFHDQPHFQREFKAMTGLTPAEFLGHRAAAAALAGGGRVDRVPGEVTSVLLPARAAGEVPLGCGRFLQDGPCTAMTG
ncbi:helix-turn-helix domain-containing protein [Streptomyces sp. NPDC059851]|uniref:helix-turn-helix transcriptional regulator n=1 Tax=Streptomyces sp. NPDC059851 TaxID=3346971 RepID=UPI003649FD5A